MSNDLGIRPNTVLYLCLSLVVPVVIQVWYELYFPIISLQASGYWIKRLILQRTALSNTTINERKINANRSIDRTVNRTLFFVEVVATPTHTGSTSWPRAVREDRTISQTPAQPEGPSQLFLLLRQHRQKGLLEDNCPVERRRRVEMPGVGIETSLERKCEESVRAYLCTNGLPVLSHMYRFHIFWDIARRKPYVVYQFACEPAGE